MAREIKAARVPMIAVTAGVIRVAMVAGPGLETATGTIGTGKAAVIGIAVIGIAVTMIGTTGTGAIATIATRIDSAGAIRPSISAPAAIVMHGGHPAATTRTTGDLAIFCRAHGLARGPG